jgi:hypothetical protein
MKTIARIIILVLFSLLVNNSCFTQVSKNTSAELFIQFKELFQQIDLPINWDRRDIGKLAIPSWGPNDRYHEIPAEFISFIPEDIVRSDSTTYIRALFKLPPKNGMHLFIIVTDYMYDRYKDGELYSILTQLYLIGYDNLGNLLFHIMIAGNYVDKWDKLLKFNADYTFETRHYKFLDGIIKHPSKNHLIGLMKYTKTICEIAENETLNCTSEKIKGYFDSMPDGDYELVISYKEN